MQFQVDNNSKFYLNLVRVGPAKVLIKNNHSHNDDSWIPGFKPCLYFQNFLNILIWGFQNSIECCGYNHFEL